MKKAIAFLHLCIVQLYCVNLTAQSAERIARIDHVLQQYVDDNRLAGAVALVLKNGKPVYEKAIGWSGAYGSAYRVDPESHLVMVLMIQMLPNATDVGRTFPTFVYQAFAN
jgi:CubicO group peptidase (beta-lactamase class C family)